MVCETASIFVGVEDERDWQVSWDYRRSNLSRKAVLSWFARRFHRWEHRAPFRAREYTHRRIAEEISPISRMNVPVPGPPYRAAIIIPILFAYPIWLVQNISGSLLWPEDQLKSHVFSIYFCKKISRLFFRNNEYEDWCFI